jgi:hypothetical protein
LHELEIQKVEALKKEQDAAEKKKTDDMIA